MITASYPVQCCVLPVLRSKQFARLAVGNPYTTIVNDKQDVQELSLGCLEAFTFLERKYGGYSFIEVVRAQAGEPKERKRVLILGESLK